jgi:hypothetical protein
MQCAKSIPFAFIILCTMQELGKDADFLIEKNGGGGGGGGASYEVLFVYILF